MIHHAIEKKPVVAHQEHRAVELVERLSNASRARQVEMICRLVEHQEISVGRRQLRKCGPAALAAAQLRDLLECGIPRQAEPRQQTAALRLSELFLRRADRIHDR